MPLLAERPMGRLYGCSSAGHELRLLRASDSEARSDAASASCSASRVVDCSPARRSASRRSIRRLLLLVRALQRLVLGDQHLADLDGQREVRAYGFELHR